MSIIIFLIIIYDELSFPSLMKRFTPFLLALCLLPSCSGQSGSQPEPTTARTDSTRTDSTATLADSAVVDAVTSATHVANSPTFNGVLTLSPRQQASITSTHSGRIHSLHIVPGQSVYKGQVICTLDDPEFIELQQTYLECSAQLEYLQREYERQHVLAKEQAASQKVHEQSRADYLTMQSRAAAASAKLQALGISPQNVRAHGIQHYLPLTAPISGYATHITAHLGQYLEAGTPVCDVISSHAPLIQLTVYEKDLALMKVGGRLSFRVNGMGKTNFHATIQSIDRSVDKTDYSIKVYAQVTDADPSFRPGMYVRAKLSK